ncbi:hypothetical protein B0J17DRAFT_569932, partial [Rhizoctonia solani]
RPHVCEHCDSGFARAHDLKRHLETHKSERPHKCPNCQRSFSRKDAVSLNFTILAASHRALGTKASSCNPMHGPRQFLISETLL